VSQQAELDELAGLSVIAICTRSTGEEISKELVRNGRISEEERRKHYGKYL
jgi:hypothetical protein